MGKFILRLIVSLFVVWSMMYAYHWHFGGQINIVLMVVLTVTSAMSSGER